MGSSVGVETREALPGRAARRRAPGRRDRPGSPAPPSRLRYWLPPLFAWVLVVVLCAIALDWVVGMQRSGWERRQRDRAAIAANYTGVYMDDLMRRERALAERFLAAPVVSQPELSRVVQALGFTAGGVFDANGILQAVVPHRAELIGVDLTKTLAHIKTAVQERRPAISGSVISPTLRVPAVALAVPYATGDGRRIFSGVFPVQDSPLGRYLDESAKRWGAGGHVFLADANWNLVGASVPIPTSGQEVIPLSAVDPPLSRAVSREASGLYASGGGWFFASAPVGNTGWRVVTDVPQRSLYAPVRSAEASSRWLLAALSVLGLVVALMLGTARRRRALADLQIRALNEELGARGAELARSNAELEAAHGQLTQANSELETRVRQRTAELERSNRNLASFNYSVAHDLRSPLRAMSGFSTQLLERYGDRLDERGRHYAERIKLAATKMGQLIDDLLQLASISRVELNPTSIDLSAMASDIATELSTHQPSRDVVWDIQPGVTVVGDPGLLRAALVNLLGNAWKFTAMRPVAHISLGTEPAGPGQIGCYVRDDGVGFDPAYRDKLFKPFQRLHRPSEFPGSGIGLANVNSIIERHGGHVWAQGRPDAGATIHFTLARETNGAGQERS